MAYFSNGTEGMMYEEKYCDRCVNNRTGHRWMEDVKSCPIWDAQHDYNYSQHGDDEKSKVIKEILNLLIPTREDGHAGQCEMFIEEIIADDKEEQYLEELRFGEVK